MVVLAERIPTCERELARNELVGFAGPALLARESDERLVALVRDGDENAFAAIVTRYRQPLERHCRRTLSPSRAEDALQQTFAKAYVALSEGAQPVALRAWLYAIAHNTAVNGLRDRDREGESLEGAGEYGVHQQTHEIVARRESLRSVVRAVVSLPARQRQVLVRQEFEGASQEQIASELGLSTGAVRQLAHRARTTVRAAAGALIPAPLWRLLPWQVGWTGGGDVALNSAFTAVVGKTAVVLLMATAAGGAVELTAGIPSASAPSHSRVAAPRAPAANGAAVTGAGRARTGSGALGAAGAPTTSHRGSAARPAGGGNGTADAHGATTAGAGAGATSSVEGPSDGQPAAPGAGSAPQSGSGTAAASDHPQGSGDAGAGAGTHGGAPGDHQEASISDTADAPESSSADTEVQAVDAVEIDLPAAEEPDAPDVVEPDTGAPSASRGSTTPAVTAPAPSATSGSSG